MKLKLQNQAMDMYVRVVEEVGKRVQDGVQTSNITSETSNESRDSFVTTEDSQPSLQSILQ